MNNSNIWGMTGGHSGFGFLGPPPTQAGISPTFGGGTPSGNQGNNQTTPLGGAGTSFIDPSKIFEHIMTNENSPISKAYNMFNESLTPLQNFLLKAQHGTSGGSIPFETWKAFNGVPGLFTGFLNNQWSEEAKNKIFTSNQSALLNQILKMLTSQ